MTERLTRRAAIAKLGISGGALLLAGCGAGANAVLSGSTVNATWVDPTGDGQLRLGPGERLIARADLGRAVPAVTELARLAHMTDAHVLDASSPARVTFLDRLGAPFESTFRPHETLTSQVLAGTVRAVRALHPDAVIQGGDLIDNDQSNELDQALAVIRGGLVRPGSGPDGYYGVQLASDPDPFYYRPDLDAPRHPGLLTAATRPFWTRGLGVAWYPVLGDHDTLVAGEIVPTPLTRALALGDRALWELPPGLRVPPGTRLYAGGSPDGPPRPLVVEELLRQALTGPTVRVPADKSRGELAASEVIGRLRSASGTGGAGARMDYRVDVAPRVRMIVLDLVRRAGGSGGLVTPDQVAWLADELSAAGERWLLVVSHQPLARSEGGEQLLELLDHHPRVAAALAGHTHRNSIVPRPSPGGGYWLITTASLIDYPQQARALRILETANGGVAIETWMLDHISSGELGVISRQLSYVDAQGGRPQGFAGDRLDRNVTLYRDPA